MKQLIEQQREDFMKRFIEPKGTHFLLSSWADEYDEIFGWHKQSLNQFIDELIAREEEQLKDEKDFELSYDLSSFRGRVEDYRVGFNDAKNGVIAHLKKLKEELQ